MVSVQLLTDIAKTKGLIFEYDMPLDAWVTRDKATNMLLAEYADVSVKLMTERSWREEFNKLKPSQYR